MKILSAENNVSYTANNACKIYIIKQEDYENRDKFEKDYAQVFGDATNPNKLISGNSSLHFNEKGIKLVPLISFDPLSDLYEDYSINSNAVDCPEFQGKGKIEHLYFLSSLQELRNCPLLDFSKLAYVFQMDGQSKGGLANVISFNVNFSVNGQSSAELVLNNKDFKYNFKYFEDKTKYPFHLKSYFDTNDIVIIRYQKKNVVETSLLNSFKKTQVDYWRDPYISSKEDPFTTIFTGYINDINSSFSFNNGVQTLTLSCTGPSKKLTWTRFISNAAPASKDSASRLGTISAFANPQTVNDKNKTDISNDNVIKYSIVRTYSGVLNIPEAKRAKEEFEINFDKSNNIRTSAEIDALKELIKGEQDTKKLEEYNKELQQKQSDLTQRWQKAREDYNNIINANMNNFIVESEDKNRIFIKNQSFLNESDFGKSPYIFVIAGTKQPAYQWAFNNFSSLFQSDFSTVYQFIKGIADNLQFNFYDDPYGTIHFSIPDMTLMHLYNAKDPNNLNQILNFAETQNTENIANVQYCGASWTYNLSMDMINTVAKDYLSIKKYGEKVMQPQPIVGLIQPSALRYAAKMRMAKYNRKALSNIRITMNGEPCLQMDKYAYIRSLRKLFYIESYSHSYNAGGEFTTSLNGTYTRDILALAEIKSSSNSKYNNKFTNKTNYLSDLYNSSNLPTSKLDTSSVVSNIVQKSNANALMQELQHADTIEKIREIVDNFEFVSDDLLAQNIYQIYVDNWAYPKDDENLKFDIAAMYNKNSLPYCYLDGFFWALPFDVNPFEIAKQIQDDEINKTKQLTKTINGKSSKPKTKVVNNVIKKEMPKLVIKAGPASDSNGIITVDDAGIIKRTWQRIQNFYAINIMQRGK